MIYQIFIFFVLHVITKYIRQARALEALATDYIISDNRNYETLYIDTDSFTGRYGELKYKSIKLGYEGINYK